MLKHISEYLAEQQNLDPAFRESMKRIADEARAEKGTVAEAFRAQELLRAAVEWHQAHEGEQLPTPLLAMLCAARRCC